MLLTRGDAGPSPAIQPRSFQPAPDAPDASRDFRPISFGSHTALWQSAVFFGVAHYFGTPGGLPGAGVTVFLGWLLAKGMLEARGVFWAWWIHVLSDVAIFTFLATSLA